jgi:hypothetical protein
VKFLCGNVSSALHFSMETYGGRANIPNLKSINLRIKCYSP